MTNDRQRTPFPKGLWLKANFLGWLGGVMLILFLSSALDAIGIEHLQFYLGLGMGTTVGCAQWVVLRKLHLANGYWMLISALGLSIPFFFFELLPEGSVSHVVPWSMISGAVLVGVLQGKMLLRQASNAFLWIPACLMGWSLAVLTVFAMDYTMQLKAQLASNLLLALINLFLILAGGLVLGLITGPVMKKIADNRFPEY